MEVLAPLYSEAKAIMEQRGRDYGHSWPDEGFDGLVYNIKRKYRRLFHQVIVRKELPSKDTCLDLANYALMLYALVELVPDMIKRVGEP